MSAREMKRLIPFIYSERAIDRDLVDEGQQNLLDYLQKKGYFDAKVTTTFQRQRSRFMLVYQIDRGKKHNVDAITFHGNHPNLRIRFASTESRSRNLTFGPTAVLSQKLIKQSASNLMALYRDRGYEEAKVTPHVTDHEPKIDVAFEIRRRSTDRDRER